MTEEHKAVLQRMIGFLQSFNSNPHFTEETKEAAALEERILRDRLCNSEFHAVDSLADKTADIG